MSKDLLLFENDYLTCYFPETGLIPGYVVLFIKNDITSVDQLSQSGKLVLIDTIAALQKTIKKVIAPERIYTLSIGEVQPKLHFHIFPRTKQLLLDYQSKLALPSDQPVSGMHLFEWARKEYEKTPFDHYVQLNKQLKLELLA